MRRAPAIVLTASALILVTIIWWSSPSDALHSHEAIAQLESPDPSVRMHAADRLGRILAINPDTPGAVDALIVALDDSNRLVQRAATASLTGSGLRSRSAIPSLSATLRDSLHPRAREQAALVLGSLGATAGEEVIDALTRALGDTESDVRLAAVGALGRIGVPARRALTALARLASDTSRQVRLKVAEAAAAIDPTAQESQEIFLTLTRDSDSTVRREATNALASMRTTPRRAKSAGDAAEPRRNP